MFANRAFLVVAALLWAGACSVQAQIAVKEPQRLAGTEWLGSESLPGYGKLTFQFHSGGKVIMIDAKETSEGKYEAERDKIVITFAGGNVIYTGKMKGTEMAGDAIDTNLKPWKWSVSLKTKLAADGKSEPAVVAKAPPPAKKAPITPPATSGAIGVTPPPAKSTTPPATSGGKLTAANLPDRLKKLGYSVEVVPTEIGGSYCVVTLEKDGWNFVIEVSVPRPGEVWMTAPLAEVAKDKISPTRLLQILESNLTAGPCFFCYRAADNHLVMKLEVVHTDDAGFRSDFNTLANRIRASHSLWSDEAK